MPNFELRKIEVVKGKQSFVELVIDGIGQLSDFEISIKDKREASSLRSIFTYMEYVANGISLPHTKFRELKGARDGKEYEFKKDSLRVYAIQIENGKMIVLCGHKNTQKQDINKFRLLKAKYLKSLR